MNIGGWGKVYARTPLFKGCEVFVCMDHGGIIVSKDTLHTHPYFEKLKSVDLSKFKMENGDYAFEQDCNASIILALVPREVLKVHYSYCESEETYTGFYEHCLIMLEQFNPDVLEVITGNQTHQNDPRIV
ncbi:hypothetical protein [Acinetobacter indicus]|uniref:hypothetical protein n=1 Tax=Acinetobacter indicus TaxID=756892 RepID=UPI003988B518